MRTLGEIGLEIAEYERILNVSKRTRAPFTHEVEKYLEELKAERKAVLDKLLNRSDEKIDDSVDKRSEVQDSIASIRCSMIGCRYRHFKGSIYIVDSIAVHSETAEPLVIYYEEHESNRMWARPLSMFLSPVDKKKYPDATQEMRFEKIYGEVTIV